MNLNILTKCIRVHWHGKEQVELKWRPKDVTEKIFEETQMQLAMFGQAIVAYCKDCQSLYVVPFKDADVQDG